MVEAGKPVAAVCHGPAGFVGATRADGEPLVKGKKVNCFIDEEEKAVELDGVVPFLLESKLRELGATVETADKFTPKVVEDGNLLTGQNPMSAHPLAERLRDRLKGVDTSEKAA
jgi:putative intracellular protease/amidase